MVATAGRTVAIGLLIALCVAIPTRVRSQPPAEHIAVIVHPDNDVSDLTLRGLRTLFRLDRQFWPNGRRVVVFLPPSGSVEKRVLLQQLYAFSEQDLRRFWTGRLFQGAIPAIPSSFRRPASAAMAVARSRGGLAALRASQVPANVRIVTIDGVGPGEDGYPLVATPAP